MKRFLTLFACTAALGTLPPSVLAAGGWRDITPAEEQFVQLVEQRVYAQLRATAQRMGSRWKIDSLKTNEFQRTAVDEATHKDRPHEVRVEFHMAHLPADDAELGELDRQLDLFDQKVSRMDPVPDALMRTNPAFQRELSATIIVNYGGFMPLSLKAAAALGEVIDVPGTAYAYQRWKQMGQGAPKRILFLGEFRRGPHKGEERLLEAFSHTPDCTNVRTIIVEVTSDESVSDQFVKALDLKDLNTLIANH